MKKLFTTRELVVAPSVTISFEKLITVPDWWDYLVYNFLVTLHGDMTVTKPAEPPPPSPPPQPPPPPPPPPEKLREEPAKVPDDIIRNADGILDEDWDQLRDYRRKVRQEESPEAEEGDSESSEDKITEPNFVVPSHHLTVAILDILLGDFGLLIALFSYAGSGLPSRELAARTATHPTDSGEKGQLLRQWRLHPILQHVLCCVLLRNRRTDKELQGIALPVNERSRLHSNLDSIGFLSQRRLRDGLDIRKGRQPEDNNWS